MTDLTTSRVTRIPVRYSRTLLIRGVVVWVVARLMALAIFMLIATSADRETAAAFTEGNPLILAAWTLILSAVLVRVDLYRRHEVALLNNLGVITSHAILLGTVPAVVMEIAVVLVR